MPCSLGRRRCFGRNAVAGNDVDRLIEAIVSGIGLGAFETGIEYATDRRPADGGRRPELAHLMLAALRIALEVQGLGSLPADIDIASPRADLENKGVRLVDEVTARDRDGFSDNWLSDLLAILLKGDAADNQVIRLHHGWITFRRRGGSGSNVRRQVGVALTFKVGRRR